MARRTILSALWFASIYLASEVVWSIAATPRALNALLALGAAAFVFADPFRLFHPLMTGRVAPVVPTTRTPDAPLASR